MNKFVVTLHKIADNHKFSFILSKPKTKKKLLDYLGDLYHQYHASDHEKTKQCLSAWWLTKRLDLEDNDQVFNEDLLSMTKEIFNGKAKIGYITIRLKSVNTFMKSRDERN